MVMTEKARSSDIDPTAGALHCIQIGGRYLVRIKEGYSKEADANGYSLVPVQNISSELILVLGKTRHITRKDFVTCLRTGNAVMGDSSRGKVYDVKIKGNHIIKAIEQAVEEGKGLALVSGSQIENGNGVSMFRGGTEGDPKDASIRITSLQQLRHINLTNLQRRGKYLIERRTVADQVRRSIKPKRRFGILTGSQTEDEPIEFGKTHEILPVTVNLNGENIEAVATSDCRHLLTPRVSTEPYRLPEEVNSKLYARAKRFVYDLEAQGSGKEYRLGEEDIEMLRKTCGHTNLVDDLEKKLIANRLILAGIKLLRGVDEGVNGGKR